VTTTPAQEQFRAISTFPHEALRAHLDAARALLGRELPGPIPHEPLTSADSTKEQIHD
jgi:hypothetical protein